MIILAAGVVIIGVINALKPQPVPDEEALAKAQHVQVNVRPASRQSVSLSATAQGTVAPKREIDLVAEVSGRVVDVAADIEDGAFFQQGKLLIQIDDRDYQAAYSSAQARLVSARRALAEEEGRSSQAQREWRDLGDAKANDLFLRKPQLAESESNLASADADLQIAKINLDRTKIRAPFDGRIRKLFVDVGQYVTVGTPIIDVYDISAAEVRLPLSDHQIAVLKLPLGRATQNGPTARLWAKIGGKTYEWDGIITRTDATVDSQSRMYYAIAEVENPFDIAAGDDHVPLMPGLFVSAEIAGKTLDDVLVLPRATLVRRNYVYTLDANHSVVLESVSVLKKDDHRVWLRADFENGTPIVLNKHALISPGTQVDPVMESAAGIRGVAAKGIAGQ